MSNTKIIPTSHAEKMGHRRKPSMFVERLTIRTHKDERGIALALASMQNEDPIGSNIAELSFTSPEQAAKMENRYAKLALARQVMMEKTVVTPEVQEPPVITVAPTPPAQAPPLQPLAPPTAAVTATGDLSGTMEPAYSKAAFEAEARQLVMDSQNPHETPTNYVGLHPRETGTTDHAGDFFGDAGYIDLGRNPNLSADGDLSHAV